MSTNREIVVAAARSLRSTLGREPRPHEVVTLLVRNQVPLLSLADRDAAGTSTASPTDASLSTNELVDAVPASRSFQDAVAEEQARYDEVHSNFAVAERLWVSRGARSICFKSAGIQPSFPYTSENFDILFPPEDEPAVKSVLDELGYVLLANCDEPQKWLYRLFESGRSLCAIHVHTRVGWGQGFMIEPEIWRRRRPSTDDPVTSVPGPEDVVLINAAHAFFENKEFGLHDIMKVRQAIFDGVDWSYVDFVARERGWLPALHFSLAIMGTLERRLFDEPSIPVERFDITVAANKNMSMRIERARSQPLAMPFATSWEMVKTLFIAKIARDKHEPLSFKPALLALTLARAVRSQTGARPQNSALFTFSGADGSGKTRQATSLLEAIELSELRGEVVWARLGATPAMRRLSRFWSPKSEYAEGQPLHETIEGYLAENQSKAPTSRADSWPGMVWASIAGADFAWWLLQIRWKLVRGRIVIADRYLCDLDVELAAKLPSRTGFRNTVLSVLSVIAPHPVRGFLLDIDAAQATARAVPDGGELEAEEAVKMYRAKVGQYELLRVDASQAFEAVSSVVQREALRAYLNRLFTIGDLFYFKNPFQQNQPVRKQPETAPKADDAISDALTDAALSDHAHGRTRGSETDSRTV